MKHRLKSLLGEAVVNRIMMGTFHSVAVRCERSLSPLQRKVSTSPFVVPFCHTTDLRKYGKGIELPNNFVIADTSDR